MINKNILFLLIGFLAWPVCVLAQQPAGSDVSRVEALFNAGRGKGEFLALKGQIQSLLKENKDLEGQYAIFQEKFFDLQKKRRAVEILERNNILYEKKLQKRLDALLLNIPKDEGKIQGFNQLKLYDLQYQKKELELDLKAQQTVSQQKDRDYIRPLEVLEKQSEENKKQQGPMILQIEDLEKKMEASSVEYELLKEKTVQLEQQLQLRSDEQKSLSRKKDLMRQIQVKEKERAAIKSAIEDKEKELANLKKGNNNGYASAENVLGAVERIDQENQQLRRQLFELRKSQ